MKNKISLLGVGFATLIFTISHFANADLTISPPTFPNSNTVRVTLSGTDTGHVYTVLYAPALLNTNTPWFIGATGVVGQTVFDINSGANANLFIRALGTNLPTPVTETVATPTFSPNGGTFAFATNVVVTCTTLGASIYWTTNGLTPTNTDNLVSSGGTVSLDRICTLKAKAFKPGSTDSGVATADFFINSPPLVSAGSQQIIGGGSTTLQGYVGDDGLPSGNPLTKTWSKVSGPGTVTFGNANQTNTTATFGTDGIYVLQLVGSDGQYSVTNKVTIAGNPTISVSLTAPSSGSTYTVPTNFVLTATASATVTQVAFYANSTLIGTASSSPFIFDWKSVSVGNLALTAVAYSSDPNNTGLASSPVNVTVDWPSDIGRYTMSSTDLEIPVAGIPITINRLYDTSDGNSGSFGNNGKLDYEKVHIQTSGSLASGWVGGRSGATYYISESSSHMITVSLSENEQYYFVPSFFFNLSGTRTINAGQAPNCYNFYNVHLVCTPVGQGQLTVAAPGDVGMDDGLSGWTVPLTAVYYDGDGWPMFNYEPSLSDFTFTAPDGTKYNFDGSGNLTRRTDRNGNYLQYNSSGIVHSSGRQVIFTRDGNNRITAIYDPNSQDGFGGITGPAALTYSYSSLGNLTNVSRLINRASSLYVSTAFGYSDGNYRDFITSITDARGILVQQNEYDSQGRLTKQYDAYARAKVFNYADPQRHIVTDRLGRSTTQVFTSSGLLASVQDASGATIIYGYDSQGRRTAETNANGQATTYAYDSNDQIVAVTNALNQASSSTYNQFGQPLVVIDNSGKGTTNTYDSNGNILSTANPLGVVSCYGYDAQGNQIAETNAFGTDYQAVTRNQYDQYGALTNVIDALGNSTAYTYDANGNRLSETRKRTRLDGGIQAVLTQSIFDAANQIVATVDANGFTNRVVFNEIGKQMFAIDALNRTNKYFYDSNGTLTNTTYPDGTFEVSVLDAEGQRINSIDQGGRTTTFYYTSAGRLEKTVYADGTATGSSYDFAGRVAATFQYPNGSAMMPGPGPIVTHFGYDSVGQRTAITNALSQVTRFAFDANGNQTNTVDSLSHTSRYAFDALNRQVQTIYPDNTTESYGFDSLGRRFAVTNQSGVVTRFGFDLLGRLIAVTNAFGTSQQMVTRYGYDEVGFQMFQIDALNRTNKFDYDPVGRRIKHVLPGNQAETFGFDPVGNLVRATNFNGIVITNQYDALNRLIDKSSVGGYRISFAYSPTGQRTNMTDASGTTSYTHDSRDRLLTKSTPQGTLTYGYNEFGNLETVQSSTANGTLVTYGFDLLNRITNVTDRFDNSTAYGFDDVGNLQTIRHPNAATNSYFYDSLNRLTNITVRNASGTIASFTYSLASAGNRTNLVENINGSSRTSQWQYDSLYRLTNEVVTGAAPTGTVGYKYDLVGNRTNRTSTLAGITNQTFSYGTNDWISGDIFDANGNTRTNGANIYLYDAENHLTNANNGTVVLVYDGDGNRVKSVVGGVTTYYLVDDRNPTGYPQVLEELSTIGATPSRLYTYGLDLISQRQSDGTTSFYGHDGNGNVRFLTGANGAISDTYTYEAFGNLVANSGSTPNNYRFSGEQYDPNLGFYYLRARYLNPSTGRFWTRDSQDGSEFDPASLHRYTYCGNNPINFVDPSGHEFNLTATLTAIGIQATLFVNQVGPSLTRAFQAGASVAGRVFTQIGAEAEGFALQVMQLAQRVNSQIVIEKGITRGRNLLDFAVRLGDKVVDLEVKYKLPEKVGPQLDRLVSQAQSSVLAGEGQTVIWTLKEPTLQELQLASQQLGTTFNSVQFVHGVDGLFNYLKLYLGF